MSKPILVVKKDRERTYPLFDEFVKRQEESFSSKFIEENGNILWNDSDLTKLNTSFYKAKIKKNDTIEFNAIDQLLETFNSSFIIAIPELKSTFGFTLLYNFEIWI